MRDFVLLLVSVWLCWGTNCFSAARLDKEDYTAAIPIDFSCVGYRYGIKDIPVCPANITLHAPADGTDATAMIQKALDEVKTPGAVLLKGGEYKVSAPLVISRDGVVLRGERNKTVIRYVGKEQISIIHVGKKNKRELGKSVGITENAPVGQEWVNVQDPSVFTVGEEVTVFFYPNEKWIQDLKMDQIAPRPRLKQWKPSDYKLYWSRKITRIEKGKIWFDAPLVMALDKEYAQKMSLVKTVWDRIEECGVEDLIIDNDYDETVLDAKGNQVDEAHAWSGIEVNAAQHSWVKGITSRHMGFSIVTLKSGARNVTVKDCVSLEPVSQITGGRRYALYIGGGELCLFENCKADHDRHGVVTSARVPGPSVFLNCVMTNMYNGIGPHHRWATGILYDNCKTDGLIELQDRGNWGTGHGWAGANHVLWNCEGKEIVCQNPWNVALNWCVGGVGTKVGGRLERPDGIWLSYGKHVEPASLYRYQLARKAPGHVINYDESAVPEYTLPDPLVSESGRKIKNVKQWEKVRRPELLALFEKEMFGKMPGKPAGLHFKVLKEDRNALGGKATRKEVAVYFDAEEKSSMIILMHIPNDRKGPVPAFVGANFMCNHGTTEDPGVSMPDPERLKTYSRRYWNIKRGENARRWPYEYIISQGYAVVTFAREDVDPDWHDGFKNGVHGVIDSGKSRQADSWGTIAAWSWGLSRALDYLETDPAVDSRKVAVIGHSRLGKASLWAGATDPRFAVVISNDSGCCGAAISRRCFGEHIKRINTSFPHWFCENFHKYSANETELPFDQHELIALIAPRPVYVASASEDLWADPKGEMLSLVHASPVYMLYGYESFKADELPPVNTPMSTDIMGYHLRDGKHDIILYDWQQYVAFADKFLK